jgi:hypothetical protein
VSLARVSYRRKKGVQADGGQQLAEHCELLNLFCFALGSINAFLLLRWSGIKSVASSSCLTLVPCVSNRPAGENVISHTSGLFWSYGWPLCLMANTRIVRIHMPRLTRQRFLLSSQLCHSVTAQAHPHPSVHPSPVLGRPKLFI